ncbi:MAG: GNAT family N-acetyltransferase [Ruegeria sp.]
MTDFSFRDAAMGDVEAIRTCIRAAYSDVLHNIPDLPDVTEGLDQDIRDQSVVVAEKGGMIVGVVVFGPVDRAVKIFNLAVSPKAQGNGLAGRLLLVAENAARENGCPILCLTTHRLMADTRAMYRHLGWTECGGEGNKIYFEKAV